MNVLVLLFSAFLLALVNVNGEVVTGTVSSGQFSYLGKFCFSADPGNDVVGNIAIQLSVNNAQANQNTYLALYDDQPDSWPKIFHQNMACSDKINATSHFYKWLQPVTYSLNDNTKPTGSGSYNLKGSDVPIRQQTRPRFWYLAIANCDRNDGVSDVSYNIHFTNVQYTNWDTEFGANEKGLNTLYLVYFFIYVVFVVVQLYGVRVMYGKLNYLHPLIKLLTVVILIEFIALLLGLLHYGVYSNDGVGVPALLKLSAVLLIISRLLFIALLLLLSRGWTISTNEIRGKWPTIVSIFIFTVIHVIILLWTYVAEDPAETDVPYTVYVLLNLLIVCYVIFAVLFIYFAGRSYMDEEHGVKKNLYLKLLFLFSLWFLLPPLSEWGVYALEDWQRERVVQAVNITVTSVGYMVLAFLLWPSRADEYFYVSTPNVESSDIGYDPLLM